MGTIAVDIFFISSGFLVTASLLIRQSITEFLWGRFLRIFPALFVMLILTVFGVDLFFTTLSWTSYFTDFKLYKYFLKCSTLIAGVAYEFPGVFESNPYKNAVNGSLWTLPYEVRLYAILAIIWLFLRIVPKFRQKVFNYIIILSAFLAGILVLLMYFDIVKNNFHFSWRLHFMFFTGSAYFILKG